MPITLTVPSAVTIYGVSITPTIPLASGTVPYTAFIQNTGSSLSNTVLRTVITQGTARREVGGRTIQCGSGTVGELPTGSCSVSSQVGAMNDPAPGTGILIPGPATLEIQLNQLNGGVSTNLYTFTTPTTLVISGPTIINIELPTLNVLIGGETTYNVTFYNPGATVLDAGIQGSVSQGSVMGGAGGFPVECPGKQFGELPPGPCTMNNVTLNTSNQNGGTWQPGAAEFLLELSSGSTLLNSQTRTIFFYQIQ